MTRIKDPKQVANTIRHILLILISSLKVCFMTGRTGCRLLLRCMCVCVCVCVCVRVGGGEE